MSTNRRTLSVMAPIEAKGCAHRSGADALYPQAHNLRQASDVVVVVWLTQRNSAFGGLEGGGVEIGGAGGDRRHQAGGLREDLAGEEAGRHDLLVEELGAEAAAVTGL